MDVLFINDQFIDTLFNIVSIFIFVFIGTYTNMFLTISFYDPKKDKKKQKPKKLKPFTLILSALVLSMFYLILFNGKISIRDNPGVFMPTAFFTGLAGLRIVEMFINRPSKFLSNLSKYIGSRLLKLASHLTSDDDDEEDDQDDDLDNDLAET